MSKLSDIDEEADALNVPKSWIYAHTRLKGPDQIPHLKIGKYCRFEHEKVLEWLRGRQNG